MLRQDLLCELIHLVQIRPFLAVDLDVDEELVHDLGSGRILEGFVSHDVTPVACRVAD